MQQFLLKKTPTSYSEVVFSIYEFYGISLQKSCDRWGDKNNFHIHHIPTIKSIYPNAYFIHIVRDGRDVATSYKRLNSAMIDHQYAPKLSGEINKIAIEWKSALEKINRDLSNVHSNQFSEIRFEDLLRDPEKQLERICAEIGEEYSSEMLNYYKKNELEPEEFMMWKEKTKEKPRPQEIGKYKKELNLGEIHEFESVAGRCLMHYGYRLSE